MKRIQHVCQSVEGALKNWTKSGWDQIGKANGISGKEVKEAFKQYLREGKLVIPIGDPCDGFDYKKGCPGHEVKE